jgi:hypothetical protein
MFDSLTLGTKERYFLSMRESFALYKGISRQYSENDVLTYVIHLLPDHLLTELYNSKDRHNFMRTVLQWFKDDFMKWVPKDLQCNSCNISMNIRLFQGTSWKLKRIEVYECPRCGSEYIFPRYGEIRKIADSRIGRCSEWSMLFGAILNSLSIPTRIVHDYLDHCWNESMIDEKWVHVDSTLEYPISLNHPYYYEESWGKKYEYILAFSPNDFEDITSSYTKKWNTDVQIRRKKNYTEGKISKFIRLYSAI